MRGLLSALVLGALAMTPAARGDLVLELVPSGGGFSVRTSGYEDLASYQVEVLLSGVGLDKAKVSAEQPNSGYIFTDNDPSFPTFESVIYDSSNDSSLGAGQVRVVFSDFYTGSASEGSVTWADASSPSWIGIVTIDPSVAVVSTQFLVDALILVDPAGNPIRGFDELAANLGAVPEPASMLMALCGASAVGVCLAASRRRNRSRS